MAYYHELKWCEPFFATFYCHFLPEILKLRRKVWIWVGYSQLSGLLTHRQSLLVLPANFSISSLFLLAGLPLLHMLSHGR